MDVNKVIKDGETLLDLTDTTATANDVKLGKIFHDVSGAITTGLLSGGLEYEEGSYTPQADINRPYITFNNTHNKAPFYVIMIDATEAYNNTTRPLRLFEYVDIWGLFGVRYPSTNNGPWRYGVIVGTENSTSSNSVLHLEYSSDETGKSSKSYPRYWVDEEGFYPSNTSYPTLNKLTAGRTYKWIAIWK